MTSAIAAADASTFRHYLSILNRRKWILALTLVLVPVTALTFSLNTSPLYEAEADVLLSRQNLAASLGGATDPSFFVDETRFAETQAELASVPEVAERTVDAVGLTDRSGRDLLRASTVEAKPNVDLLEFRVRDPDRGLATRLANEYARQFTIFHGEINSAAVERALSEVRSRIAQLQGAGSDGNAPLIQSLIDKEQQLLTLQALQTSNTFVVRESAQAEKIRPRPTRTVMLGIILGIGLGLVLAFLAEALDPRIRSIDELSERLPIPLLGSVPSPERSVRRSSGIAMIDEPQTPSAEAFRMLRTNVDFANLDRNAQTIMITSSVEGEGKSTTAANLAVAYARSGRRVILVDLDLRRPMINELFGFPARPGLTDVAVGYARLDQALRTVPLERPTGGSLVVLSAGTPPPDPSEFVSSPRVQGLLEQLRQQNSLVLIDAPPLLQVGDAMALTPNVDAMLLVARLKVVSRPMMREVNRILEASPAPKLGFVATGVTAGQTYGYTYASYTYRPGTRRSWWFARGRKRRQTLGLEAVDSVPHETVQQTTPSAARARRGG
jgi:succinoglycan biosynthesis transport protein ExoP